MNQIITLLESKKKDMSTSTDEARFLDKVIGWIKEDEDYRSLPEVFKIGDVAEVLGVSVFTVRRYVKQGKLKATRAHEDAHWMFKRDDVFRFIK